MLAQKLNEGDVPDYRALIKLAIYTGRIDLDNIPSNFLDAWATLASARPDTQTLKEIIEGRADIQLAIRFALKALTKVPLNDAINFFNIMKRMIGRSA